MRTNQTRQDQMEEHLHKSIRSNGNKAWLTSTNVLITVCIFIAGLTYHSGIKSNQIERNETDIKAESAERKSEDVAIRKELTRAIDSINSTIKEGDRSMEGRISELISVLKQQRTNND